MLAGDGSPFLLSVQGTLCTQYLPSTHPLIPLTCHPPVPDGSKAHYLAEEQPNYWQMGVWGNLSGCGGNCSVPLKSDICPLTTQEAVTLTLPRPTRTSG